MTKEKIINAILAFINEKAKELDLTVVDEGTGHAFDNSFWKGIAVDDSNIPSVTASNDSYSIKLRSFWGSPELDIRKTIEKEEEVKHELYVITFSDSVCKYISEDTDFASIGLMTCADIIRKGLVTVTDIVATNEADASFSCDYYDGIVNYNGKSIDVKHVWIYKDTTEKEPEILRGLLQRGETEDLLDYLIGSRQITEYVHTGDYVISEVRVDAKDYKTAIAEAYSIIDKLEAYDG